MIASLVVFGVWDMVAGLIADVVLLDFGAQGSNQHVVQALRPGTRNRLNAILMGACFWMVSLVLPQRASHGTSLAGLPFARRGRFFLRLLGCRSGVEVLSQLNSYPKVYTTLSTRHPILLGASLDRLPSFGPIRPVACPHGNRRVEMTSSNASITDGVSPSRSGGARRSAPISICSQSL